MNEIARNNPKDDLTNRSLNNERKSHMHFIKEKKNAKKKKKK